MLEAYPEATPLHLDARDGQDDQDDQELDHRQLAGS
jgi:hypothetical protein